MTIPPDRGLDRTARAEVHSPVKERREALGSFGGENASAAVAFLAAISHEIRTPVNAILGYHELLELGIAGPLTEKQRLYIERASVSGRHLLGIIDEVLDFARLDADRLPVEREAFRLGGVMNDALLLVAPQARQRKIDLTNASSRVAHGLAAWGDPSRVKQILVNLLSNAIKFTESRDGGSGRVTIAAGTSDQSPPGYLANTNGPFVYVRVEDTGTGIPADRLDAIFEPFVQSDPSIVRRFGGSGLGLAISRRLARLMGGDLTAHSDLGLGSSFFLWLPAAPAEVLDADSIEAKEERIASPHYEGVLRPLVELDQPPRKSTVFVAIGEAILQALESIVQRYLQRLATDPLTPSAKGESTSRIEDHLATFLADLAATYDHWEVGDKELTDSFLDSSAIQRTIAMKHGAQRARLGWSEEEIRREHQIMEEEVSRVIRAAMDDGRSEFDPNHRADVGAALALLGRFIAVAQRRSLTSWRVARERESSE